MVGLQPQPGAGMVSCWWGRGITSSRGRRPGLDRALSERPALAIRGDSIPFSQRLRRTKTGAGWKTDRGQASRHAVLRLRWQNLEVGAVFRHQRNLLPLCQSLPKAGPLLGSRPTQPAQSSKQLAGDANPGLRRPEQRWLGIGGLLGRYREHPADNYTRGGPSRRRNTPSCGGAPHAGP